MKKIISIVLLVIPFILTVIYWNDLPDQIPLHWNASGEIDKYSDSKWGILVMPGLSLLIFLFLFVVPKIDPKGNFGQFLQTYWTIMNILMLFFLLIFMLVLYVSLGYEFDQSLVIYSAICVLFLLLGNFFGKIRPNYFIGIRTPWTLENEQVWKKTHKFGGVLWVVTSLLMLLIIFILPEVGRSIFVPYVLLIALIPAVYSYIVFKNLSVKETSEL